MKAAHLYKFKLIAQHTPYDLRLITACIERNRYEVLKNFQYNRYIVNMTVCDQNTLTRSKTYQYVMYDTIYSPLIGSSYPPPNCTLSLYLYKSGHDYTGIKCQLPAHLPHSMHTVIDSENI